MNLLRLKTVVAAIDRDDASLVILGAAQTLARAAGARLHVVHATPPHAVAEASPGASPDVLPHAVEGQTIETLLDRANVRSDHAQVHVSAGEPAHVIRLIADRLRADVIVLGPHREGRGAERQLGGTALAIATASWAPCLIVKRAIRLPLQRVLVPVDLSDTARGALTVALSWASALRAADAPAGSAPSTALTAMHVEPPAATSRGHGTGASKLDDELNQMRRDAGDWASVAIDAITIANTDVAGAIAERAREEHADLVVLGTRGQGLDAVGRLGSVSAAVIHDLEAPVLLVPPAVWTELAERHS
jgi:nucleotide-binding universal stress UspA family protein